MERKPLISAPIAVFLTISNASAGEFKIGSIVVENPRTRETPKGATIGDGYLSVKNNGTAADRLVRGSVSVAKGLEIHTTTIDDGVAKMRQVTDGVEIKSGETVNFEPGSSHIMFVNLAQPLHAGETVRGTFTFEHAGTIEIEYAVLGMGAKAPEVDRSQTK